MTYKLEVKVNGTRIEKSQFFKIFVNNRFIGEGGRLVLDVLKITNL